MGPNLLFRSALPHHHSSRILLFLICKNGVTEICSCTCVACGHGRALGTGHLLRRDLLRLSHDRRHRYPNGWGRRLLYLGLVGNPRLGNRHWYFLLLCLVSGGSPRYRWRNILPQYGKAGKLRRCLCPLVSFLLFGGLFSLGGFWDFFSAFRGL